MAGNLPAFFEHPLTPNMNKAAVLLGGGTSNYSNGFESFRSGRLRQSQPRSVQSHSRDRGSRRATVSGDTHDLLLAAPTSADEAGLASALQWYVSGFGERSKIKVNLHCPPHLPRLSSELEISIFRIVQEWLTNISPS
jgi:hypothetical protein